MSKYCIYDIEILRTKNIQYFLNMFIYGPCEHHLSLQDDDQIDTS